MNIPKDIANLIGSYSQPTLWEMIITKYPSNPYIIEKYLFYAENVENIYKHIKNSKPLLDTIYGLIYTLDINKIYFFPDECKFKRFVDSGEYNFNIKEVKEYLLNNTEKMLTALSNLENSGFELKIVDNIINLY